MNAAREERTTPDTDCEPSAGTAAAIRLVEYDERVRILAVEFANGLCCHYLDVPEPVYVALAAAPDASEYFRRQIAGRYACRRIG